MVEGNKTIRELYHSNYEIEEIFSIYPKDEYFKKWNVKKYSQITPQELKKISFLQHPKDSVALCKIPKLQQIQAYDFNLILDGIQDPGNLGTIIRLADWFGINQIICSPDTADVYNPKAIQATMGSFTRVHIIYTNLEKFLQETEACNIGTDTVGTSLYEFSFPKKINLVLGNEGNGMRTTTKQHLDKTICIPRFGKHQSTESLNVSMATGIILGHFFSKKQ